MTAFVAADLPATINTVEKLHAWSSTVLNHLYPNDTVVEAAGSANRVMTANPFYIVETENPGWRYITRASFGLNANWQRTGKVWEHATDLGSSSIPAEFKS